MILITGASGRIASRTAELLAAQGLTLRLMSRAPDRVTPRDGAEIVAGDFAQPETLDAAFAGIATAFVVSAGRATPGARARLHKAAFDAASRAGVGHVVYLSLKGSGPASRYPFCRDHHASELFLAETGLPHTVLRIAFYQDMFVDKFDETGVMRGPAGDGAGAFVSREDTARAAAAVLADPPGGIVAVTGPEALGLAEVARRLGQLSGRSLRYENEPAGAMRIRLAAAGLSEIARDLEIGWFEAIAAGEQSPATGDFQALTGAAPQDLAAYFATHPDRLGPLA